MKSDIPTQERQVTLPKSDGKEAICQTDSSLNCCSHTAFYRLLEINCDHISLISNIYLILELDSNVSRSVRSIIDENIRQQPGH